MQMFLTRPWLKSFAGLSINVSAAWFALALIAPQVSYPEIILFLSLMKNIFFGIVFLVLSVVIEKHLENYDKS